MARLQLFLLGGFSVSLDDQPVTGFESDKVRALLAYIALEGDRPLRREMLAALLWPELSERRARHNLRQALFNLRTAIGDQQSKPPFLTITSQTIEFNKSSSTWSDVTAFTQAHTANLEHQHGQLTFCEPCLERLEEAAGLYQGRFLNGLSLKGCQEFNEWTMIEAQRLHNQAVGNLTQLVMIHQAQGSTDRMLVYATQWVALEPYDEAGHRALMLALALTGGWKAALNQYKTCRDLFIDELGVKPDAQTQELYKYILAGEVPSDYTFVRLTHVGVSKPVGECPYRGLAAFKEEDASFFFGREVFVDQLQERLGCYPPITIILGPSGSGKSSAIYAGLLPRLREKDDLLIPMMRPGSYPFQSLSVALQSLQVPGTNDLDSTNEAHQRSDVHWVELCDQVGKMGDGSRRVLLIVDQFEELFTLCPDLETRRRFLSELLRAVESSSEDGSRRCLVLMTLRADFMGQVLSHRPFADALQDACLLMGPMSREELREAIIRPAGIQGVGFESGLVARLLDDVGEQPGHLPLLEFALTLLWERCENGILTHSAYEQIGRVKGALASYADEVYENLTGEEQESSQLIFLQLVQPGDGTDDTRRVAYKDELGEEKWPLVQHLATRRLVVTGRDQSGRDYVEVAHEALIQSWGRFREWMRVDRAFRVWQEGLRWSIRQWEQSSHSEGALIRGAPLVEAEGWLDERGYGLSLTERNYIQASGEWQQRRQAKRDRQRKLMVSVLAVGLLIASLLILSIWQQRQEARRQASIGLASQAISELEGPYPERAVLLALGALENYPYTWQAERALGQSILDNRLRQILTHEDFINTAEWSVDGHKILAASSDGAMHLWDAHTGDELLRIIEGAPTIAIWSPDEKYILGVNGKKNLLKVWDAETGEERLSLDQDDLGGQLNITLERWQPWSPDGDHFLTYNLSGTLKIWNTQSGNATRVLDPHPEAITQSSQDSAQTDFESIAHYFSGEIQDQALWSPNGEFIAAASLVNNLVTIWQVDTGEALHILPGQFEDQRVSIAGWSSSGDRFATRGLGGVKIYDTSSGDLLSTLPVPGVYIYRALWSPNGERILSMGIDDGIARLWDLDTDQEIFLRMPDLGESTGLAWSADGDLIAVGDVDGVVHIWDMTKNLEILKLYGGKPRIKGIAFSPDGKRVLVTCDEKTLNIHELYEAPVRITFPGGPENFISTVIWSPDGKQIAVGATAFNKAVKIWDASSGEEHLALIGHKGTVWSTSWSPSGDFIASAGEDQTIRVWDAKTGVEKFIFTGHTDTPINAYWSSDSAQVASNDISSGKVIVWDPIKGKENLAFSGHQGLALGLAWSPIGDRILSVGTQGEALIWGSATGKMLLDLFPQDFELDIVFGGWTKDGKRVFVQSMDGVIHIFDASRGKELWQFATHQASFSQIDLSPAEQRLILGGYGGPRVYDFQTGNELLHYAISGYTDTAYSPDGTQILIGSQYGALEIYPAWNSVEELIAYAKSCCVLRELTPEERDQFGLPPLRE